MAIRVREPGLLSTVQDTGRFGEYALGMPPSGAMDVFSYQVGNYLVGNAEGAAGLEITYFGPELEFTEAALIALTGAEMPPKINGEEAPRWEALEVAEGDVLTFDYLRNGARSYLAVAGGIEVPLFMHSRSTYTLIGLGGHEGRALQEGDELETGESQDGESPNGGERVGKRVDEEHIPTYSSETELRVIIGLASYRITEESMEEFLSTTWSVTPDADRVGYRYRGGELKFVEREQPAGAGSDPANVVDFGYPIGSIQVPGGVEPIVLMNDAVTGGGYATIGTVISADRDRLAQTKTNDKTRFRSVELEEALEARKQRRQQMEEITACAGIPLGFSGRKTFSKLAERAESGSRRLKRLKAADRRARRREGRRHESRSKLRHGGKLWALEDGLRRGDDAIHLLGQRRGRLPRRRSARHAQDRRAGQGARGGGRHPLWV